MVIMYTNKIHVKDTIAVPIFENLTFRYRKVSIDQKLLILGSAFY